MSRLVDPFYKVNSTYGSPMGRRSGNWLFTNQSKLCAKHQGGGQGYDSGGAYWGTPSNIWAVWERAQPDSVQYVRAGSRLSAINAVLVAHGLDKREISH